MRVLLTNDDGIMAPGLQAVPAALRELDGIEVDVIAPDSNRSATARSITTRSPLTVEEVDFGDGDHGFATDGTPVDCVRFAELGLLGGRPDLIVSGINHGANLGDDITYSGRSPPPSRASCSASRRWRSPSSPRAAAWGT